MARKVTFYTFTFMTNKKKITHVLRWGKPQNFLLAFIDELWKTRKIRILAKWNKLLEISSFYTCVPKITFIWGTVAEIRSETEFFVILSHFLPLCPLTTWKIKILKKWQGSTYWVVIRDPQGFEFSWLNSLLSWAFSQNVKNHWNYKWICDI